VLVVGRISNPSSWVPKRHGRIGNPSYFLGHRDNGNDHSSETDAIGCVVVSGRG